MTIYRHRSAMNFGEALEHLRDGRSVMRESWDNYERLIYVPGSEFEITADRPMGKALPNSVGFTASYAPHIDVVDRDLNVRVWLPSQFDLLAQDWMLSEEEE